MPTPKVLVITPDRLGPSMAGPAIRAAAIADAVSKQNETVLLSLNEASEQIVSGAKVVTTNGKKWVKWADVVIYQGIVLEHFRQLRKGKKFLIADMYDPLHIEYLGSAANTSMYVRRAVLSVTAASIGLQMRLSDLILAASPNQVSLWQSHMAAWNVIDPTEYDKDPEGYLKVVSKDTIKRAFPDIDVEHPEKLNKYQKAMIYELNRAVNRAIVQGAVQTQ